MYSLHWLHPTGLLLLLLLPLLGWWQHRHLRTRKQLPFSSLEQVQKLDNRGIWAHLIGFYRYGYLLAWGLTAIALAGPQQIVDQWPMWDKGIDLVFVLDLSESMKATDLPPTRIDTAKRLLLHILTQKRQRNDRFGLVIFANKAYTLCPLTVDHAMLREMLKDVASGQIGSNTAIGDAIATALARLRHHPKRRRAILLITDGETNAGRIHPLRAALRARKMNIPIHAILMGRDAGQGTSSPSPSVSPLPKDRIEVAATPWGALQQIAQFSGGKAHRIPTQKTLERTFNRLLQTMLPTRIRKPRLYSVYKDIYMWFLWPALGLFGLLILLELTRLRHVP